MYYGISGMGAITHTLNFRLNPEQAVYIINHAEDKIIFVELPFVPILESLQDKLETVEKYVESAQPGGILARVARSHIRIGTFEYARNKNNGVLKSLADYSSDSTISGKIAKSVLEEVWESGSDVDEIVETKGLVQIQDESILVEIAKKVVESNPDQVTAYKGGKDKLFSFFVGQVMKETQGKANPKSVNEILKKILN